MKDKNPIDELFRERLEHKELRPSDQVWSKIEANISSSNGRRGNFYWMRAAVITLLVGVSSLVYFSQNQEVLTEVGPDKHQVAQEEQNPEPAKGNSEKTKTEDKSDKPAGDAQKQDAPRKKVVPIMKKSRVESHHFVELEPELIDENALEQEDTFEPGEVNLKNPESTSMPVFKLKYTVPVTQKSFYANHEEPAGKPKLKERVFAYANNQFNNLLSGEPVELPKTDKKGKPQLEINLGKLFNN